MRAIRRFTVRAALPASRSPRCASLMLNLRWSWHAADPRRCSRRSTRRAGRTPGSDPVALLGAGAAGAARRARRRRGLPAPARRGAPATCDEYLTGPRWYQLRRGQACRRPGGDRLLLAGVRHHRGAAAVLRRPRHPGRRPPQVGQRPRRAADRRRPALPARLLHASRCRPRAGSRSATRRATRTGCRSTLLRDADGRAGPGQRRPCPSGRMLAAQIWVAQVGRVPLLLLDSDVEENEPAAARGHRPALRRRQRAPAAPGAAARHRRGAGGPRVLRAHRPPAARGLPHQRGPRRLPRPGADPRATPGQGSTFDEALELCRAGTVFTTHTPVPAGHRPVRRGS